MGRRDLNSDPTNAERDRVGTHAAGERQATQRQLVERGMKIPGVAEALEAYAEIERFAGAASHQPRTRIRYATGGNA